MALGLQLHSFQVISSGGVPTQVVLQCNTTNVAGLTDQGVTFTWALSGAQQTTVEGWLAAVVSQLETVAGVTVTPS